MSQTSFSPVAWCRNSNIYEINLRQYSTEGNFAAFAKSLPRLKDMGIEILWFMPITPIAHKGRKGPLGSYYASADFYTTNPEFGSIEDFTSLVKQAQDLGFKVIIDWVANHTGMDHTWTTQSPDFFKINEKGEFYDSNGWDDVIDLDYTNPEMRKAMIEAMKFWVNTCNIDGFRCDMAMLVPLDFWIDARTQLDQIKPLFWLAECEEPEYHAAFDVTYTWEWMHKSADFVKGTADLAALDHLLWKYHDKFAPEAIRLYFTTNHDENSWNGTEFEKYKDAYEAFAVFSCTWNGMPLIYSGQELPNKKRLKFFEKDPIEWNDQPAYHNFYKTLLHLRKEYECMKAGNPASVCKIKTTEDQHIFAFVRTSGKDQVLVLLNFSPHSVGFNMQDAAVDGSYNNILDGGNYVFHPGYRYFHLQPWDYKIFAFSKK